MWWMGDSDGSIGRNNKLRPLMPRQAIMQTPWNHPMGRVGDEYGLGPRAHTVALVSTRWNPTPEQLQGLEELYRRGTRTPSAEQIQHIASRLRRFGKIEGKNVFYWFQNHKARERQKKRRQLHPPTAGLSKRPYLDHNKLATPTIPPPQEESASMHGSVIAERKKDVWTQSDDEISNITSWKLDVSPSTNINIYTSIPTPAQPTNHVPGMKTLQLFPIRTIDTDHHDGGNQSGLNNNHFIEFLPTKKYI